MKILHYSLGLPPYRSGGLVKFSVDLMKQQVKQGNIVSLLWPGELTVVSKSSRIRKKRPFEGIENYEIINPIPVPYDEGITKPEMFMKEGENEQYEKLLSHLNPDVIHIHTLMGLHKSFLEVAKKHGIRMIFTAHDFFPICPKVTMFRNGDICNSVYSCQECEICNQTALSLSQIFLLQSPIYMKFKDSRIVKTMRKKHRDEFLSVNEHQISANSNSNAENYLALRNHYSNMLSLIDLVHYNSSITQAVYEQYIGIYPSKVINISHLDIQDHRKRKDYNHSCIRIRYLGPQGEAKGFYLLQTALDRLWSERQDFCLDIHFVPQRKSPYMKIHEKYKYCDLEYIFDRTDVLVSPSILYETFGYTVLEALSYGVPVIISDRVGAKDVLTTNAGIVIESIDSNRLFNVLKNLSLKLLGEMNSIIVKNQTIQTMDQFSKQILEAYSIDGSY